MRLNVRSKNQNIIKLFFMANTLEFGNFKKNTITAQLFKIKEMKWWLCKIHCCTYLSDICRIFTPYQTPRVFELGFVRHPTLMQLLMKNLLELLQQYKYKIYKPWIVLNHEHCTKCISYLQVLRWHHFI